jgi:hypothetical protein
VRHAQALHNEWGGLAARDVEMDAIPCDYLRPGDLVDPSLTHKGRRDVRSKVHDVLDSGLLAQAMGTQSGTPLGNRLRAFSSPLSRCMQTSEIALRNLTGAEQVAGAVTVSELLRERIDTRVPFETRRPVSFDPRRGHRANGAEAGDSAGHEDEGQGAGEGGETVTEGDAKVGRCSLIPS